MKLKRWLPVLLAGLLLWPHPGVQAQAEDASGTLTLQLTEEGEREGVRFSLEKVATLEDGNYRLLDAYTDTGVDLNGLKTAADLAEAAQNLAQAAPEQPVQAVEMRTDSNGEARAILDTGVWLARQRDGAGYGWIAPFLCAIPSWDLDSQHMTWDTVVQPKREPFPDLVIEKVDEQGHPVTGLDFRFVLEQDGQRQEGVTDPETGTVRFDLRWGSSAISEEKAPAGYEKSTRVIRVSLGDTVLVDGREADIQDGVIRVAYVNRKEPAAPGRTPTGLDSRAGLWLAAGLAAAAGMALVFALLRKRSDS